MTTRLLLVTLAALLIATAPTRACNIPVFRYALEKWQPDLYELLVLHRDPLNAEEKAVVDKLMMLAEANPPSPNFAVQDLDLAAQPADSVRELLAALPKLELPALVLRYPSRSTLDGTAWVGRVTEESAKQLLDSPARRELVRRLVAGDSAVWLLVESGDKSKDDRAAALLDSQLAKVQKELKLPQLTSRPEDQLSEGPPLRLVFSYLRLKHGAAAETVFVKSLRQLEPDPACAGEPMVLPVFGRGRVPNTLVGDGINQTNLKLLGTALVGPCTCTVKEQSPGVDLLLAADWNSLRADRRPLAEASPPPLSSLAAVTGAGSTAAPTPAVPTVAAPAREMKEGARDSHLVRNCVVGLVAGLSVVGLVSLVLWGKGRRRR